MVTALLTGKVCVKDFYRRASSNEKSRLRTIRYPTRRKFHLPQGRTVKCKATGYFFRILDDAVFDEYDGLVIGHEDVWSEELQRIRDLQLEGKHVEILCIDDDTTFNMSTWLEVFQLRDAFLQGGACEVDYVYYER